jgi:hypothetical protein
VRRRRQGWGAAEGEEGRGGEGNALVREESNGGSYRRKGEERERERVLERDEERKAD